MSSFNTGKQKKGANSFGDNFIQKALFALQSFAKTSPFEKTSYERNEKLNKRKDKGRKLSKGIKNNRKSTNEDSSSTSSDDDDDLRERLIVQRTIKRPSKDYRKSANEDFKQQLIVQRTKKRPSNEHRKFTNDASSSTSSDDDNDLRQRLIVQQTIKRPSNQYRKSANDDFKNQPIIQQTNKRPSNEHRKFPIVNDYNYTSTSSDDDLRQRLIVQQAIKRPSKESKHSNLSQRTPLLQSRKNQNSISKRKYTYTNKANLLDSDSTSSNSSSRDPRLKIKRLSSQCQIIAPRLSTNTIKTSLAKNNHAKVSETEDSESSSDSSDETDETQQHDNQGSKRPHTQISNSSPKEIALRKRSRIDSYNNSLYSPVQNLEYFVSEKDPLEIVSNELTQNFSSSLQNGQNSSGGYENLYYQYENFIREQDEENNFCNNNEDEKLYGQIQDIDEEFGISLKQENFRRSESPVPKHAILGNIMHPDPSPSSSWASGQSLNPIKRKIRQQKHGIFVNEDSNDIILKPTMDIDMFIPENSEVDPDEYSLYSEQGTKIKQHENYETSPSKFSTVLHPVIVEPQSEVESSYSTETQSMAEDDRDFEEEMHEMGLKLNKSLPSNSFNKNKRTRKSSINEKATGKKKTKKSDFSNKYLSKPMSSDEIDSDTESAKYLQDSLEAFLKSNSITPEPIWKSKTKEISQKKSTYCSINTSNVNQSEKVTFRNSKISKNASKQNKVNMHKLSSSSSDSDSSDSENPASRLPQVAITKQNINIPKKQLDSLSSNSDTGFQAPCHSRNAIQQQQSILPRRSSLTSTNSRGSERPLPIYSPQRRSLRSNKTKEPVISKITTKTTTRRDISIDRENGCFESSIKEITNCLEEMSKDDLDTTKEIENSVQPEPNFMAETNQNLQPDIDIDADEAVTSNIDPLKKECMNRKLIVKVENSILPQCKTCKQLFLTKDQLSQHEIKTHQDIKPVPSLPTPLNRICYFCDAKFRLKCLLDLHINSKHTMEKAFKCQTCGNEFVLKCLLKRHQRGLQHIPPEVEPEIQPVKVFKCTECNKILESNRKLKRHLRTHFPNEHRCKICKKLFSEKCYLKIHMSIHTGTKPFPCPNKKCDKSYLKPKDLSDHIKSVHGKEV